MPGIGEPCVPEAQGEDASTHRVRGSCSHPVVGSWISPSFPSNSKMFVWDILPDTPSGPMPGFPEGAFLAGLQDTGVHIRTLGEVPWASDSLQPLHHARSHHR